MDYSVLGKTGLRVSRLGYGAAGLGNIYTHLDQEGANRSVAMAIEEYGINYFDIAPSYGTEGLGETRLGIALEGRRDRAVLSTKCGRYDHGVENGQHYEFTYEPKRTRLELENSLRRLKTDYVDIYQLHDFTAAPSLEYLVNETIPVLEKMRQEGKIRYIGITSSSLPHLEALTRMAPGSVDNILTFGVYNLLDTSLVGALDDVRRETGVGVVNSSITFLGIITKDSHGALGIGERNPDFVHTRQKTAEAEAVCERYGTDLGTLAVKFGLCCEEYADATLVSMCRVVRLRQNAELYEHRHDIDPELLKQVLGILKDAKPFSGKPGKGGNREKEKK